MSHPDPRLESVDHRRRYSSVDRSSGAGILGKRRFLNHIRLIDRRLRLVSLKQIKNSLSKHKIKKKDMYRHNDRTQSEIPHRPGTVQSGHRLHAVSRCRYCEGDWYSEGTRCRAASEASCSRVMPVPGMRLGRQLGSSVDQFSGEVQKKSERALMNQQTGTPQRC